MVGVDFGLVALLATGRVVPRASLQASLDVDEAALLQVLRSGFRKLAGALIPDHHVVVVGELTLLAGRRITHCLRRVAGEIDRAQCAGWRDVAGRCPRLHPS